MEMHTSRTIVACRPHDAERSTPKRPNSTTGAIMAFRPHNQSIMPFLPRRKLGCVAGTSHTAMPMHRGKGRFQPAKKPRTCREPDIRQTRAHLREDRAMHLVLGKNKSSTSLPERPILLETCAGTNRQRAQADLFRPCLLDLWGRAQRVEPTREARSPPEVARHPILRGSSIIERKMTTTPGSVRKGSVPSGAEPNARAEQHLPTTLPFRTTCFRADLCVQL